MAGRRRKNKGPQITNAETLRSLWKKVDVHRWYALLREVAPHQQWHINGATQISGLCPYHQDTDPSFKLDLRGCQGKCFGSCGKHVTDIIQLFTHLRGSTYSETLIWLDDRIGIRDLLGDAAESLASAHHIQEMKKAAAIAYTEVCQEYVREQPKHLSYLEPGIVYLEQGRNIPRAILPMLPVALFPKPEHAKKYIPEAYYDAFDTYFAKYQNPAFWGSVMFHYNDAPGFISRFKIRKKDPKAEALLKEFVSKGELTVDNAKRLITKDFLFLDDPITQETGVFGLHHYVRKLGHHAESSVYVTEGEFDALSVMVGQIMNDQHDIIMLASGGVGGTSLSFLRDLGVRTVFLVQDSPVKRGDAIACSFLKNKKNFERDGAQKPLSFKVFEWPPMLQGGDLDEAVQINGYDVISQYLYGGSTSYFQDSLLWVQEKCKHAIDRIRTDYAGRIMALSPDDEGFEKQKTNLALERDRQAYTVVQEWFQYLHDPSDRLVYTQTCSRELGMDLSQLDTVRNAIYRPDTPEGARESVKNALSEYIQFAYYKADVNAKHNVFCMWAKKRNELVQVPMNNDSAISSVFSQYLEMNMLDWTKSLLGGDNSILDDGCKQDGGALSAEKRRSNNALFLMKQVLEDMSSTCPALADLTTYGQGIHMWDLTAYGKRNSYGYVVNGSKVFRGKYTIDTAQPVEWELLDNTVDGDMLFNLSKDKRWSVIDDVSTLYSATSIDLKKVYGDIRAVLDGWKFENDEINKAYLAAWIMAVPTMKATGAVNITFLTGESASGKTSLLRGLLGGSSSAGYGIPALLESAVFSSDATAAWMYQEMVGSALLLVLDEAETGTGTSIHNNRMRDMQEMMYSIPMGGHKVNRGGSTADQRSSAVIRMPVIMGAINMNADTTFLSRVFVVRTQKDPKRKNCSSYIYDRFTGEQLDELRKNITLALIPHMPALINLRVRLKKELEHCMEGTAATDRFIETVLPALAVYKFIDPEHHDPVQLFKDIVEINRSRLESINTVSSKDELIDAVLYTSAVKTTNADGIADFKPARGLIKEGEVNLLNSSECGVFCIPEKRLIVIVWRMAKHTVLRQTPHVRTPETSMKESVSHNRHVIPLVSEEDHEYIVDYLGLSDVKSSTEYTALSLDYLLNSQEQEVLLAMAAEKGRQREQARIRRNGSAAGGNPNELPPVDVYEADMPAAEAELGFSF